MTGIVARHITSVILALLLTAIVPDTAAQSTYTADVGVYASIDVAESVLRGARRLDGPGIGGRVGFRSEHFDLAAYVRRAGDSYYNNQRWRSGSTTFGPVIGVTRRFEDRSASIRATGAAYIVLDDHTERVVPRDGPTTYEEGPGITAFSIRTSAAYYRQARLSSGVSLWPTVGMYAFYRTEPAHVDYYFSGGRKTPFQEPRRSEYSVGIVVGLPLTAEIVPGHHLGFEPMIEVDPRHVLLGAVGVHASINYNF